MCARNEINAWLISVSVLYLIFAAVVWIKNFCMTFILFFISIVLHIYGATLLRSIEDFGCERDVVNVFWVSVLFGSFMAIVGLSLTCASLVKSTVTDLSEV